ncbi:Galactosyl T domain containing protein [Asbolus verrucosus]|uniref:Hexosyltransferase n=1 Tax=Asbolus verrucosus TaxID=1661398 RepID=A0A482VCR8_ASBVE|nr:Galactosyl T domain containing protein [Asbolus verrucosus]
MSRRHIDSFMTEVKINRKLWYFILVSLLLILFVCYTKPHRAHIEVQVEGWGHNSTRDFSLYLNASSRILPKNFCKRKSLLLVMVHSKPSNVEQRRAIRISWGAFSRNPNNSVSLFFLLGKTADPLTEQVTKTESEYFGDIIQEEFVDAYLNLTLKSLAMLKLANLHCQHSCKYLLKTDDDTFVNLANVVQMLTREGSADLLVGHLVCAAAPVRNPRSKWYASRRLYPQAKYPNYVIGGGYLMSLEVAKKLYRVAQQTPIFHMEDVYVTGICAKQAQVEPRHSDLFSKTKNLWRTCFLKKIFAIYDVEVNDMIKMDSIVTRTDWRECSKPEKFSSLRWVFKNIIRISDNPFSYRKYCK